jgi:hypothetical protein
MKQPVVPEAGGLGGSPEAPIRLEWVDCVRRPRLTGADKHRTLADQPRATKQVCVGGPTQTCLDPLISQDFEPKTGIHFSAILLRAPDRSQ